MSKYQINQQVEAIVERILPSGVFMRLVNGTEAYIRRSELDLNALASRIGDEQWQLPDELIR